LKTKSSTLFVDQEKRSSCFDGSSAWQADFSEKDVSRLFLLINLMATVYRAGERRLSKRVIVEKRSGDTIKLDEVSTMRYCAKASFIKRSVSAAMDANILRTNIDSILIKKKHRPSLEYLTKAECLKTIQVYSPMDISFTLYLEFRLGTGVKKIQGQAMSAGKLMVHYDVETAQLAFFSRPQKSGRATWASTQFAIEVEKEFGVEDAGTRSLLLSVLNEHDAATNRDLLTEAGIELCEEHSQET
jgi:hypothetical protein